MRVWLFLVGLLGFAAASESTGMGDLIESGDTAPSGDKLSEYCKVSVADWACSGPKFTQSHVWASWARSDRPMPFAYKAAMWSSPVVVLVAMIIWLRVLWPSPPQKVSTVTAGFGDKKDPLVPSVLGAGDAVLSESQPYLSDWKTGFDLAFPVGWVCFLVVLTGVSMFSKDLPLVKTDVLVGKEFMNLLVKFGVMLSSSIIGGLFARAFCIVDDRGYVRTNEKGKTMAKNTWFKVNYTRKLQHFSAYATPILFKSPFPRENWLTVCWGDMATLLGFLVVIKPIRECSAFFMMQFNSFDRPEDRPYTLKWIVLGDIVPGMIVLAAFYAVFGPYNLINGVPVTEMCYIFAMVAGLGDGLAEPVGVYAGTHKYEVGALCAGGEVRKYQRSMEGSCCVAWWTYIFVVQKWFLFPNATSFWLTWLVLPPLMAWSEARSPHTMDTPFIFLVGGFWLWAMLYVPAIGLFEPSL